MGGNRRLSLGSHQNTKPETVTWSMETLVAHRTGFLRGKAGQLWRRHARGSKGAGFMVQVSGVRVWDWGFRVQGSGFTVKNSGLRVEGQGFRVWG